MVQFDRSGSSGNIFWILGAAYSEMIKAGKAVKGREMCDRVYNSGDYEEALKIIGEYVELAEVKA